MSQTNRLVDYTNSSVLVVSFTLQWHLGKIPVHLPAASSSRNLEQSYFLMTISFRIRWTLLQKSKSSFLAWLHEGSLKSAEQSEASHKCKTSPRNTKIIMRSEKTYLTRSWLHFKMTPSRTRWHHVSQGSPDTLHSFVLDPVFNWMLILQKKVQHNNKDQVWIFWEVFQPRGCHSTKHVLNKTCNVLNA